MCKNLKGMIDFKAQKQYHYTILFLQFVKHGLAQRSAENAPNFDTIHLYDLNMGFWISYRIKVT